MDLKPFWDVNSRSVTELFPSIFFNPNVHYCVHKSQPLVPVPINLNPVHTTLVYFSKTQFNITFPFYIYFFLAILSLWLYHQNPVFIYLHFHPHYTVYGSRLLLFHHSNYIWQSVIVKKLLIILYSPNSYYFIFLGSKYSPQHSLYKHPHSTVLPHCQRTIFTYRKQRAKFMFAC
jgi:hypothetical protein